METNRAPEHADYTGRRPRASYARQGDSDPRDTARDAGEIPRKAGWYFPGLPEPHLMQASDPTPPPGYAKALNDFWQAHHNHQPHGLNRERLGHATASLAVPYYAYPGATLRYDGYGQGAGTFDQVWEIPPTNHGADPELLIIECKGPRASLGKASTGVQLTDPDVDRIITTTTAKDPALGQDLMQARRDGRLSRAVVAALDDPTPDHHAYVEHLGAVPPKPALTTTPAIPTTTPPTTAPLYTPLKEEAPNPPRSSNLAPGPNPSPSPSPSPSPKIKRHKPRP